MEVVYNAYNTNNSILEKFQAISIPSRKFSNLHFITFREISIVGTVEPGILRA